MARRLIAGVAIVALGLTLGAAPGASSAGATAVTRPGTVSSTQDLLARWRRAVETHRPGHSDDGTQLILDWTDDDLRRFRRGLLDILTQLAAGKSSALRSSPDAQAAGLADPGSVNRMLSRAAMLHADVAIVESSVGRTAGRQSSNARSTTVVLDDGRAAGFMARSEHWPIARALLGAIHPVPADDPFVRQFYLATSLYLASDLRFDELAPHVRRALEYFSGDAAFWLISGAMHEYYASERVQTALFNSPARARSDVRRAPEELDSARTAFSRAVNANPANGEARLHLGRVLGLIGRHDEAMAELARARALLRDRVALFCADLFLGREAQALGRFDDARAFFERAAERYPRAQSARLSLSQLAILRGDATSAVAALADAIDPAAVDVLSADPWWVYSLSHTRDLVAEMRRLHDRVPPAVVK